MATRVLASLALILLSLSGIGQTAPTGTAPPGAVPAARQARNVAVITVTGEIDQHTFTSLNRRLTLAQRAGADAVVIELNTPGGGVDPVLKICTALKSSPIKNTVAWVHPTALSGGAVIALACREIVTSAPATFGDALPVLPLPLKFSQLPEHEQQKVLSVLMAEVVDSARLHRYDEFLVQGIVSRGVELWLVQSKETGERLFINRAEYELIFGEAPGDDPAALVTAKTITEPAGAGEQDAASMQKMVEDFLRAMEGQGRGRKRTGRGGQADAPSEESRFVPAAPDLEKLNREFRPRLDERAFYAKRDTVASSRPALSGADRGKWTLIERLSQRGAGPFVFKADQLARYGMASATVNTDAELLAFFGGKNLIRLEPTWSEGLVAILTNMWVRAILVVIFLVGLFVEMTHPGLVAPGAVAMGAFLALVLPPILIDLSAWWMLASMLTGVVLILLEVFIIPGIGVAGILGLLLLFAGLIGTFVPTGAFFPDTPGQKSDLLYGVTTLLTAIVASGVIMYFFAKHFRTLPVFNRLVLQNPVPSDEDAGDAMFAAMQVHSASLKAGMTGVAITPLRPSGRVQMTAPPGSGSDRIIDAVSDVGYIPAGTPVKVTQVSDFRIAVEPVPPST